MKKNRSSRIRLIAPLQHEASPRSLCSLAVLAALGVLGLALPQDAMAQRVIPPTTLPSLRGVVSDRSAITIRTPTAPSGGALMTIDQTSQRAIIDWNSFDIGSNAEVLFRHQMGSSASTLNRIHDANPSLIQGKLGSTGPVVNGQATPGGQIILINQNGIVFGAGAQVNTQSLIASTLNLANQRFLDGTIVGGTAAFEGRYNDAGETVVGRATGSVVLNAAANGLAAPVLQAGAGGSIMIFAPTIDNQGGVIRAPDGQVILAAGSKAYLAVNPNESDITLRGYVVEVEAPPDEALNITSLIRNAGDISADRGNVTLAAMAVNQEGRISAKTALQANGSIYLKAGTVERTYADGVMLTETRSAGRATFARGSVTEVTPDTDDKSTVPDSQPYASGGTDFRGVIDVQGHTIESHGFIRAAGGVIKLDASSVQNPDTARVYLGAGSETSVAGTWADVDYAKNLATFRVTSNELKNAPDQKDGILRGSMVTVDLRQDSNILDLTGYRGLVARTVAEKAAAGGELQLNSTGSVVQRAGATIDASGGGYRYSGGMVATTRLLGADGKIYDIANAPQQQPYLQLLDTYRSTDARWGQTRTVANPMGMQARHQAGYVEGKAGGTVSISAKAGLVLDGTLKGGVTIGERQTAAAPRGATLKIGEYDAGARLLNANQSVGNVTWAQEAGDSLGAAFNATTQLSLAQREGFTLAADQLFGPGQYTDGAWVESGFGAVEVNSSGRIVVGEGVKIESNPGAEVTLRAEQIDVAGDIRLAGGKLTLHAAQAATPVGGVAGTTDNLRVRAGAELSTAGVWVNRTDPGRAITASPPTGRANTGGAAGASSTLDGGSITLQLDHPLHQTTLERGSSLDVGGGALLGSNQRVTAGKGGSLTIANGASGQINPDWLQADLRGFALGKGGDLTLKLGHAQIVSDGSVGTAPSGTTRLEAGLFAKHGFSNVTVEAADGIDVAAGTHIKVEQHNLVLNANADMLASGGDITSVSRVQRLPDAQRGPASIHLNARGEGAVPNGSALNVAAGAVIEADPQGRIALSARDGLNLEGELIAHGGTVALTVSGPTGPGTLTEGDLHVGSTARISVAGTFVPTPNPQGLNQGTLHQGGSVTIESRRAGVRIDEGSVVDVSGLTQTVDAMLPDGRVGPSPQTLQGHAGSVLVKSQGSTVIEGTLVGHGGSPAAAGGSFALELTKPDRQPEMPLERRIVVTPGGQAVAPVEGTVDAVVDAGALAGGGFDKLRLQSENRIEFQQSTTLAFERGVRLDAPLIDVADAARVNVQGSTVSLGQSMAPRVAQSDGDTTSYNLLNFGATPDPAPATRIGTGELNVQGGFVNLYGNLTVSGTELTRIESASDIQLVGRTVNFAGTEENTQVTSRQIGGLTTAGDIELHATQIYPATRTEYNFSVKDSSTGVLVDGGRISITRNEADMGSVYSAAGKLTFEAHTLQHGGVLKAPQGEIVLNAGSALTLAPGSLTSVSSDGLTPLFGSTNAGTQWNYDDGDVARPVGAVSSQGKAITLSGPAVDVEAGATVDLRGGGDVRAVEFVKGNGGDSDITLADSTYAIVPASRLAAMPFDSHTLKARDPSIGFSMTDGRDKVLYDSIHVGTGGAVPAGEYVLLPARFALLPDAYLVELHTGAAYRNLQLGQNLVLPNGATVLAGYRSASGTGLQESQTVGVVVRPGLATARRASDYNLSGASFFAEAAERERQAAAPMPWDAGRLLIDNATALKLDGAFEVAAGRSPARVAGRVADIDISAARIAVVDVAGDDSIPEGFLQIEGAQLSNLNGNVLLGGKRSHTATGQRITASAPDSQIIVANSSTGEVNLSELTLVAGDSIDVRAGSVLTASGTAGGGSTGVIGTDAAGALVRLSAGEQVRLDRGVADSSSGTVRIEEGATLRASKSLLIDATLATESRGTLAAGGANGAGGSLSLSSGLVTLGESGESAGGGVPTGLVLSSDTLNAYSALDELVLRGYQAIDLVGNATLGSAELKELTLDAPVLRGRAGDEGAGPRVDLVAKSLVLTNNSAPAGTVASSVGQGSLNVNAERLVLGAGVKSVDGFANVNLSATDSLHSGGKGSFTAAASLNLDTPRVVADGGSQQTVRAAHTLEDGSLVHAALSLESTAPAPTPPLTTESELGGRLALQGSRVSVATSVQARSGQIEVVAHGAGEQGGITLASGALLDARGQAKDFNGTVVAADGGGVSLSAVGSRIDVTADARVDVSAADQGGSAGRMVVRADTLSLAGELAGRAGAGARSGSAELELGHASGGGFSALNTSLNAGGFAEERQLRLRHGDIGVGADDAVNARRVTLTADEGRIDVHGSVGIGAAKGGAQVNLFARDGITLAAGSELRAGATNAGARGGEVRVATSAGTLVFDDGATIDVRAGTAGPAGSVIFGVQRQGDNTLAAGATQLHGRVLRGGGATQASVDVEATRVYQVSGSVTGGEGGDIERLAAEHASFTNDSSLAAITAGLRDETGVLAGARVVGATELRSEGDLTLGANWDLTDTNWLAGGKPGTLTVRSTGNLTVSSAIGSPDDGIVAGDTWNLRLASGADLGSANPLAVRSAAELPAETGSLLLSAANAKLRTGTGRIDLAAARDVRLDNVAATIYTAGRIGAEDAEANGNNRWGVEGGGISVKAGGDVSGVLNSTGPASTRGGELWVTDWLRRSRRAGTVVRTDWWAHRARFQQGIGTLGGGDIDVVSGGSVRNLAAMLPTTGRTEGPNQVDVQGGGNLLVRAADDVIGSAFLIGRGEGRVEAGNDIGAGRATQLYLMGASSGGIAEAATLNLAAGGSVSVQSINNPTVMKLRSQTASTEDPLPSGPSFGGAIPASFYTYSPNSVVGLQAKAGDVANAGQLATAWRVFGTTGLISLDDVAQPASYPASLSFVAFDGDVSGPAGSVTTFPSEFATVQMLAGQSLRNISLYGGDRAPESVVTPLTASAQNVFSQSLNGVNGLQPTEDEPLRMVSRQSPNPFVFDFQALDGDIVGPASLNLPAVSRLRAGGNISGVDLKLQNLEATNVSVVRADQGDVVAGAELTIGGPGQLHIQAGRHIDLNQMSTPLLATGNATNRYLPADSARLTLVAGVHGDIDLPKMDAAYAEIVTLNQAANDIIALYNQLGTEPDAQRVLDATSVASLAAEDEVYARFLALDEKAPRALRAYQDALRSGSLPLAAADTAAAAGLYGLLNREGDLAKLQAAGSVAALAAGPAGAAYRDYVDLERRFGRVFTDYLQRRGEGARPTGVTPMVFSQVLDDVVREVVPGDAVSRGSIYSYQTSIQTLGGSDIDLWAPRGDIVVGLTTPRADTTVGVVTNAGGAIRGVLSGDFNINQGKVITAQGGDILLFSSQGSIDAGRGAKTSLATSPPRREVADDGTIKVIVSAAAAGSGIQTLTSDPDGLGPEVAPEAGDTYLYAPAGSIDAGEAGIRSGGNLFLNAQTVLNASNISAGGSSQGVPVAVSGSLAASIASGGGAGDGGAKAAQDAAKNAADAARAASASGMQKPNILTVEVLGFGEKNCKEQEKDCFAK